MQDRDLQSLQKAFDKLEDSLNDNKRKLAELRRQLFKREVTDYTLTAQDGSQIALSQLFGNADELLLIHNMGKSCAYCTLWADGFNGIIHHLENRAPFVVVSPDDYQTQRDFYNSRGWKFRMFSAHGTTFFKDLDFEYETGKPMPGVSTFTKSADGKIYRIASAYFGPGDDFCSLWHLFDLLPRGVNDWSPKFKY